MAAVLLLQGQGGRNKARKGKSHCGPPRALHRVSSMCSRSCASTGSWQRESPVPVGLCKGWGDLLRRVPLGRSRASSSPWGARRQQALPLRWQESGHTQLQLPGVGMGSIQLHAALRSNLPAFREF